MKLSCTVQPFVERNELRIPVERRREGGSIKRSPQTLATACDVSDAHEIAAVVIIGGEPGECGGLLAGDAADLGHAHQDGDCGAQYDAIDAVDEIEPLGEIVMHPDRSHQAL